MSTDPTEAVVRREVTRARQILREDRLLAKLGKAFPDENEDEAVDDGQPKPPVKQPPKEQPKRRGIWWGEERED